MDQLYPIEGPTTSSCASQDFDFLYYWVDQSVEKEIHRGKQLRALKQRPILHKQKYDVINIGHSDVYSEKKYTRSITNLNNRSKSPHISRKKTRKTSPKSKKSPVSKFTKKDKFAQGCPMRIAELSVPSKRQCIDTWRTKHHVLPGIMIDRLRQQVLDLRPVVKIPDAIENFKIHKKAERKKKKEIKQRKNKMAIQACDCSMKNKVKPTKIQLCRYLSTIFGHKIAKELSKPARIILNSELKLLFNIVSSEIDKLMIGCKRVEGTNFKYKRVHTEVAEKITIWISNILEESAYNILEDQLKDLEEEVGPVLDLIDDLVDDVVDICEPEPEVVEVLSSSETNSIEHESQEEEKEGDTEEEEEESREEESISQILSINVDSPEGSESTTKSLPNLDDYVKNELDKIIDSFDQDVISVDVDGITIDDPYIDTEYQPILIENQIQEEQTEFLDASDTMVVPLDENESHAKLDDLRDSSQTDQGTLITDQETDTNIITQIYDSDNDVVSEDESNKKVKFSDIHMVTIGEIMEEIANTPQHINIKQFSAPNDHLLNEADESWPDDISLPFLRPSESVSKSITSLGKIMEEEERISVVLDYNRNTKDMYPDKNGKSRDERDGVISKQKELIEQNFDNFKDETTDLSKTEVIEPLEPAADQGKDDTMESFSQKRPPQIEPPDDKVKAGMENGSKEHSQYELPIKEVIGQIIESILEKGQLQFKLPTKSADNSVGKQSKQLTPPSHKAEDGLTYPYEQKDIEFFSKYIIDNNGMIYINGGVRSPSTDSTFPLDVPTKSAEFELKLPKITEEQVIVEDKLKEETKIEVEKGDISRTRKDRIKTAELGTNTSYTIIPRAEKSTSVSSQSLGDITKYLQVKQPDWFSSVRIKPKDYKVDQKSAPIWVSRNNGEPYHEIHSKTQSKVSNDKNIRLWCKDLENGFENLELWNGWLEKTVQSFKISEMKIARICLDKSREQYVRDWLLLKRNVDADVLKWTKLNKNTQEKMKSFRKIYPNIQTPTPSPESKLGKSCNCQR